jgi:hypothetical protein
MDKEMEQCLQEMMEHLLAGQAELKADAINARMMVRQAELKEEMKADIDSKKETCEETAEASLKEFKEDVEYHMEACLEVSRSCGKRTTACQVPSVASPHNLKAGPEESEAEIFTFIERSDIVNAAGLEANAEALVATVERQKLRKHFVVLCHQWAKKWIQDSVGSQQKLYAAWKLMIRHAILELCKGHVRNVPEKI